ncbi:MAG: HU family DNA-binding protein [Prevotellaceae bacterium]|nr:HU family DNA-binding protein [Prevotellaceae bacterium]
MNKTELIAKVAAGAGLTKVDAKKAVEAAIESVKGALGKGEKVQIPGVITMAITMRPARKGKNPLTHEPLDIPAKKIVKVKIGSELSAVIK